MKNIIKVFALVLSLCLCVGCSSGNDELKTVKLAGEGNGVKTEMILEAKGDKVMTQTQISKMSLKDFDADTIKVVKDSLLEVEKMYNEYDFATYSYEITDTDIIENITIDFSTKENIKAIGEAGLVQIEGDSENTDFISLDQTVELLEKNLGLKVVSE